MIDPTHILHHVRVRRNEENTMDAIINNIYLSRDISKDLKETFGEVKMLQNSYDYFFEDELVAFYVKLKYG